MKKYEAKLKILLDQQTIKDSYYEKYVATYLRLSYQDQLQFWL